MKKSSSIIISLFVFILSINFVLADWTENLNQDLFAYYNFNDETDLISGGDNNLIVKRGEPQFLKNADSFQVGDGKSGFCPGENLDGWNINDQIDFGFDNVNVPEISFAGWAKITGPGSGRGGKPFFSKGWYDTGWVLNYDNAHIKLFLGGLSNQILESSTLINENQWYHVAIIRDSSQTCLWINGIKEGCASSKIAETNNFKMDVCGSFDNTVAFQGYLDEWGFWNKALNDNEISQLYNNGNGLTFPGLTDSDLDGILDSLDNCPNISNPNQEETDTDKIGDACDNCIYVYNPDQTDLNNDGVGNACEISGAEIEKLKKELEDLKKKQNEQEKRIFALENLIQDVKSLFVNFANKISSYLKNLPNDLRKKMVCNYMKENNLNQYQDLGLSCLINNSGKCVCQVV